MGRIEIRVLGPFEVRVDGHQVRIPPGRAQSLLAALALSPQVAVSIERLTDLVWGEDLPSNSRRTVQTNVKRLRAALGRDSIDTVSGGYLLNIAPDDVDASRFERLLESSADDSCGERAGIEAALRLWRGSPLQGFDGCSLVDYERPRLVEQYLSAVERRAELDLAADRAGEVVAGVRDLAARHPLRESLWAPLITGLARLGRSAEALECYETIRARIADELGVDPGADLRRLHAELLRGASVEPVVPAAGTAHEPAATVPRQLPADVGSFTGRGDALTQLDELLDAAPARPVVLHGPGGIGKTTLAVHWAYRVIDRFPDGQLYVNLQGFGPGKALAPETALEALLRGLGVAAETLPADLTSRGALLRTTLADRRVLLLLDNAHDAEQVRTLLPGGSTTFVLVTSRNQLRGLAAREGAARVAVEPLPFADATELLASGLDRRRISYSREELTELATLCGRLPLAITVAAEHAGREPDARLSELIAELRDENRRLDALDTGDDPLTDVRATLSWSYDALDPDTARAFRLLGLAFGRDVSLPAAAALVGAPAATARRLLERLCDAHLLERGRSGRYVMHDLVRTYAAELTECTGDPADRDGAPRRLASWYVHSAAEAHAALRFASAVQSIEIGEPEPDVTPVAFTGYDQALAWYDAEWPALTRLISYAAERQDACTVYRLVVKTSEYLHQHRGPAEALRLRQLGRDAAASAGDRVAEAYLTVQLASSQGRLGDAARATELLEHARALFLAEGHARGESLVLMNLGVAYRTGGRLTDARRSLERALELRELGAPDTGAGVLINLAHVHIDLGDAVEATRAAVGAVASARDGGHRRAEAAATEVLGMARAVAGEHVEAEGRLREAIRINRELGSRWNEAVGLVRLGRVQRTAGRAVDARASWQHALAIVDEIGEIDTRDVTRAELVGLLGSVSGGS